MQNDIQKFRQSSIVFEKPGILPEEIHFYSRDPLLSKRSIYHCLKQGVWDFFILFRS